MNWRAWTGKWRASELFLFFYIPTDPAKQNRRGSAMTTKILALIGIPHFVRNDSIYRPLGFVFLMLFLCSKLAVAQPKPIDTAHSSITVHVGKSGVFSAFGHEHVVRAPITEGSVNENLAKPQVEFRVNARQLSVADPDVKSEEREEIQRDMLGAKVLDSERYPEIRFRSTSIQRAGDSKWKVAGELTLHGETHPVDATVSGGNGRYTGAAKFKQTEFGIKPVSVAGGSVKVKDELRIEFEITAK